MTTVVLTSALISGLQFDADAQGRAVLVWGAYRGDHFEIRAVDVRDGRPQGAQKRLWRDDSVSDAELSDADVSPGGAAVVCLRERTNDRRRAWRLRIARRLPGEDWSKLIVVADQHRWAENISCGIGDNGQVTVAWLAWRNARKRPVFASTVTADGRVEPPTRLATDSILEPQTVVAPDGAATVAFTPGVENRVLQLAQRSPAGDWTTRALVPASAPKLAIDGSGRVVVGWQDTVEIGADLLTASGPAFTPAALTHEPDSNLLDLTASPRGDVLATWASHTGYLKVSLQRPGAPFADPVALGHNRDYWALNSALAADGSGAVSWERRGKLVTRLLTPDGHWSALIPAGGPLVAAPGGRVTAAWATDESGRDRVLLALMNEPAPAPVRTRSGSPVRP